MAATSFTAILLLAINLSAMPGQGSEALSPALAEISLSGVPFWADVPDFRHILSEIEYGGSVELDAPGNTLRANTEDGHMAHSHPPSDQSNKSLIIGVRRAPVARRAWLEAELKDADQKPRRVNLALRSSDGRTVLHREVMVAYGRPGAALIDTSDLPQGDHTVVVLDAVGRPDSTVPGKSLESASDISGFPSEEGSTASTGASAWADVHGEGNEWSCWGRTYQISVSQPLLAQITSQGQNLLSRPMFVGITAGGRELAWAHLGSKLVENAPGRRSMVSEFAAGSVRLRLITSLEYDGLLQFDMRIAGSNGHALLDSVFVDIPLKPENARYVLPEWPGAAEGELLGDDVSGPFTYWLWLGGENVGLIWCGESGQDWRNEDPGRQIEIIRRRESTILRLRLIDTPTRLDHPMEYRFLLQATPVKPAPSG